MKHYLRFYFWLCICLTLTLEVVSFRYLASFQNLSLWQWGHFVTLSLGHLFLLSLLLGFVSILPWTYCVKRKVVLGIAWLFSSFLLTAVVADTFVFQLYRFHLNWAMIDLFINGGSEVIHFSGEMWGQIICILGGIVLGSGAVVWFADRLSSRYSVWVLSLLLGGAFVIGNLSHAYAVAQQVISVSMISETVPWSRPVTMTTFFKKMGWANERVEKVRVDEKALLAYPLSPLTFKEVKEALNVIIVLSDSLRADMLNPVNMPNTWKISEDTIRFENHYSSGNATRAGVFGLFYGLPPSYWHSAFRAQVPSAFISSLQKKGYSIEAFASARLTSPQFNKTVFASVPDIRLGSDGQTGWERDVDSVNDFENWVDQVKGPFFSFIFLDNIHAYSTDPLREPVFTPAWETVNNLKLNNELDPTEYFNLYKNAVLDTDRNIDRIWKILDSKGLLDKTIVIISSDHGEEFNDNRQNYWGHNGNFTDAQIKIPLIVHWPGKETAKVYKHQTTAYDITATLMPEALGCENPVRDYSVGHSLWKPHPQKWFIVGSYQNSAIIEEKRIVVINGAGFLTFKNRRYQDTENTERTSNLLQAIEVMSRYRQK